MHTAEETSDDFAEGSGSAVHEFLETGNLFKLSERGDNKPDGGDDRHNGKEDFCDARESESPRVAHDHTQRREDARNAETEPLCFAVVDILHTAQCACKLAHQGDNAQTQYDRTESTLRIEPGGGFHHGLQKQHNGRQADKTERVGFEIQSSDIRHRARKNANGERDSNQTHRLFRKSPGLEPGE